MINSFGRLRHCFPILSLLCLASLDVFANGAVENPMLKMQGVEYENTCIDNEKRKLKDILVNNGAQDVIQAWSILEAILCASENTASRAYIRDLLPARIKKNVESTGDATNQRTVGASEDLISEVMARGEAWNANVEVEPRQVVMQYFSNAACIKIVKLKYIKYKWILYEFGEACD